MTDSNFTEKIQVLKAEARQRLTAIDADVATLTTERDGILAAFPDLGTAEKPKAAKKPRAPKGSVADKVQAYVNERPSVSIKDINATVLAGELGESIATVRAALRKLAA